ncbi:tRNA lysidine(34) synthetase TilS [bacterium]|nr:tRNA lysidine(34) synthetase TilS [bacterium]
MILQKFKQFIEKKGLLEKGEGVLIAYSGGIDSTGLLSLFLEIKQEWNLHLYLAHFNHRLRSTAFKDELFVRKVARSFFLPLFVGSQDVRSYAQEKGVNLEEAGRRLRYEFLNQTALGEGIQKIATAHTLNDQAETVLMRILRGTGLKGLTGISPQVNGNIIRPLLNIEKKEIQDYLQKKGMSFCVDESNKNRRYTRNRIREELIPYLERNYATGIIPRLGRLASLVQEEEAYLEKSAKEKAREFFSLRNNRLCLQADLTSRIPLALARRVVREFVSKIKGDLRGVSYEDVDQILSLEGGKKYSLKGGILLCRENDWIFSKEKKSFPLNYEYEWSGKELLEIKEIGLKFRGAKQKLEGMIPDFNDNQRVCLDLAKLDFPLRVRNRRKGDKYQPLGAPGRKKLKEIMRSRKIPRGEREKRPVFLSAGEIVWILGLPVSEKFKITEDTLESFKIEKIESYLSK